ncbi:MAG: hypothetical protein CNE99_04375 [OM182 bacterium MED-G24]|uniref:Chloramphenicol phosphotransferase n=1 Tax=OM182 bacterium MED-G24 TaxID=1986255 RepID=A0A2A5WV69_9GAMM|nr:MAG: hypothetical protein CNE99_04375 [OM182 bacterium MED-G24]
MDELVMLDLKQRKTGTIVIINGESSARKSSLLRAFLDAAAKPYLDMGLDSFLFSLSQRHLGLHWPELMAEADHAGPMGHRIVRGMHRALAAEGSNVFADHVMVKPSRATDCSIVLATLRTYLIGLHCPADVLETRERERKDRTLGHALKQHKKVHQDLIYDLTIDSSTLSAVDCAHAVLQHIDQHEPHALMDMQHMLAEADSGNGPT